MAKIAVIIPCYNAENFIERTLDSIYAQSYTDYQVYAVDDNSSDGTAEILEGNRHRLKVLCHPGKVNKGASESINLAILNSDSEYVALCDSDDIWYENKLKEQLEFLETNRETALVYSNGYVIDEHDRVLYELLPKLHREKESPHELMLDNYIRTPSSVMIRRDVFKSVGLFNGTLRVSHDHDMWLRICEKHKIGYLNAVHLGYRRRSNQLSTGKDMWSEGFRVLEYAVARYPYGRSTRRKRLAVLNYRIGMFELGNKEIIGGVCHLFKTLCLDPSRSVAHLLK
jgi:glycosyltransferase involved in cell wall biosynthesis